MFTDKNLAKAAKHKGVDILHQMKMSVVIGLSYNKEVKRKAVGFFSHHIKSTCTTYRRYVKYKKSVDISF